MYCYSVSGDCSVSQLTVTLFIVVFILFVSVCLIVVTLNNYSFQRRLCTSNHHYVALMNTDQCDETFIKTDHSKSILHHDLLYVYNLLTNPWKLIRWRKHQATNNKPLDIFLYTIKHSKICSLVCFYYINTTSNCHDDATTLVGF